MSAWAALQGVHLYQRFAAPALLRTGVRCRFQPTCSHYAEASLRQHGFLGGTWRTARRLARCGPWTPMGTIDPPR
ncbi:MAG: membrane protein insertion efficiency factor YidD [Acidobacteria bacterium]|nr:MAG: membrane protein insertion efficiency factor YidD [Acidobacteriota bacterium]